MALAADIPGGRDDRRRHAGLRPSAADATHQVLTEVHRSPDGDTHYPDFARAEWRETRREEHDGYAWVWLERVGPPSARSARGDETRNR